LFVLFSDQKLHDLSNLWSSIDYDTTISQKIMNVISHLQKICHDVIKIMSPKIHHQNEVAKM